MKTHRLMHTLALCGLLLSIAPGCQMFYQYRPMPVLVRDAETKKPIASADVHISYPLSQPEDSPWDSAGVTGKDGVAHLRAAPYGLAGILVEAAAPGYLSEQKSLSVDAVKAVAPGHLFESTDRRPPSLVVDLYAEPRPTIELIIPTGYKGLVKAELQIDENASAPAGERNFRFNVTGAGTVDIVGSPLLRRVPPVQFRARYADGMPLPLHAEEPQVGFWWLKSDGDAHTYFVGTHSEYEVAGHFGHGGDGDGEPSSGSKRQGKGRRGGRQSGGSGGD